MSVPTPACPILPLALVAALAVVALQQRLQLSLKFLQSLVLTANNYKEVLVEIIYTTRLDFKSLQSGVTMNLNLYKTHYSLNLKGEQTLQILKNTFLKQNVTTKLSKNGFDQTTINYLSNSSQRQQQKC